jgi:hypothetical protein
LKYKIIKKLFGSLLNKPCWNIKRGQWKSAISFEFGKPSLKIYERITRTPGKKPLLTRRTMVLKGEWHIMFDGCSWEAYSMGKKIGDRRSKAVPDKIARFFSGQAFKNVIIKPETGESVFIFDLGGRLETHPYDSSEQWSLFTPAGKVLSYRADGKYSFEPSNKPTPETTWKEFRV